MENTDLFERIQSLCYAKGFTIAELERMESQAKTPIYERNCVH